MSRINLSPPHAASQEILYGFGRYFLTALIKGFLSTVFFTSFMKSVYLGVKGVEKVEVSSLYNTGRDALDNAGNSIKITTIKGEEVTVIDYNGNFIRDKEDTVAPNNPSLDLTRILTNTEFKVKGRGNYVPFTRHVGHVHHF